eukprot:14700998-Ditylum_brightwellii.AAC.1
MDVMIHFHKYLVDLHLPKSGTLQQIGLSSYKSDESFLHRLLVVETWFRTCIEEASKSTEPSDCGTYVISPCHTDYIS